MSEQTKSSNLKRPLSIWLITIWEPLPAIDDNARLLRTGQLAHQLLEDQWEVTWWASTFDRARKRHRFPGPRRLEGPAGLKLNLLHAKGYKKNVSLRRVLYHRALAREFDQVAKNGERPDIVLCSFPPIEMAEAAANYTKPRGIPLVIDIRDPWPDLIADLLPRPARRFGQVALWPMYRSAAKSCRAADAIFGVSPALLAYGLLHAGRSRHENDGMFPIGYATTEPSASELAKGKHFWDQAGLSAENNEFVLCYFGMMGRHADLDTVIEAAKRLSTGDRRFKFVLCGAGDRAERYQRAAAGVPNILMTGWIDSPAIWTLMRRSTAGLAPYTAPGSLEMCLPNKPYEYFSAGLPVVSSLKGQLADLLQSEDCGVTYRSGDVDSLISTLTELYDQPSRVAEMSSKSRALYESSFVAADIYRKMSAHLRKIALGSSTAE
jgi:glycosyltransferase involved in cell wall biosynthesis